MRPVTDHTTAQTRRLSEAVLEAIADVAGVHPMELDQPLYNFLDPDALDALFRTDGGYVTFGYDDYTVTVFADGTVDVESHDSAFESTAHA